MVVEGMENIRGCESQSLSLKKEREERQAELYEAEGTARLSGTPISRRFSGKLGQWGERNWIEQRTFLWHGMTSDSVGEHCKSHARRRLRYDRSPKHSSADPLLSGPRQPITASERNMYPLLAVLFGKIEESFSCAHCHGVVLTDHSANVKLPRCAQRKPMVHRLVGAVFGPVAFEGLRDNFIRLSREHPLGPQLSGGAVGRPFNVEHIPL